jgi:hypothetical protein
MNSSDYEMIMDSSTMNFVWVSLGIHFLLTFLIYWVVGTLILSAILNHFQPNTINSFLLKMGFAEQLSPDKRRIVVTVKLISGFILLLPLVINIGWIIPTIVLVGVFFFLQYQEKIILTTNKNKGTLMRYAVMCFVLIGVAVNVFEKKEIASFSVDMFLSSMSYQQTEVAWQNETDLQAPKEGEIAPDFVPYLKDTLRLSALYNDKPTALIFGANSCPPFSESTKNILDLYEKYGEQVNFLVVYGVEPHATNEWWLASSRIGQWCYRQFDSPAAIDIKQPTKLKERNKYAARLHQKLLAKKVPLVVDKIDNQVNNRYCARPTRLYFIDKGGEILYNQGIGPYSYNLEYFEPILADYLK